MANATEPVSIEWIMGMHVLKVGLLWPIFLAAGNINLTTTESSLIFVISISMSSY